MHDTDMGPGHPDADECQPYYSQYIKLVPDGHIVATLERQIGESASYLAAFTPEQTLWREAPGEWNIVFQARPLGDVVSEYAAVRAAFVALLCGLDAAAWERRAPAEWTLRSVRAVAYTMAGHERHHLADIRRQQGR